APVYLEDPQGILSLNLSAFSALEGAAAGVLAAVIYGQRKGLPLWPTLDALTAGAALFSVFFALSHLASGDAFGSPADIPWGIELWGARRHPSQLYELLTSLAILLVVIRLQDRRAFAGELALGWLSLASASRLVLEAFRGDSLYLVGLRQAQLLALLVLMLSLAGLHLLARRRADAEPMRATGFPLESPSAS
ncbi:MAG: prolipoprotein diacylglyceryl transferase, partial [Anaerolineales bacterium]|nr:prolipoprotein diacylglyceryl transferase [Anaerolineales bacterium]